MKKITEKEYQRRILKVLSYIQKNLNTDLTLEQLAKIACFSSFHFHHIFKGMIGESIGGYIRRLKLEQSVVHLTTTKQSILEIAFDAGFETHEAYSRAFKKMFGYSPSEFRKNGKDFPIIKVVKRDLAYIQQIEKLKLVGDKIMRKVDIKKIEPISVAFIRHIGPYMQVGPTITKIIIWARANGINLNESLVIGIPHDNPHITPENELRFDACVSVNSNTQVDGNVKIQTIPGGEYAVVVHKGPYEKLSGTFHWLYGEWLPKSGREVADFSWFELYRNSPEDTKPEDLITEIYLPLK